MNISMKVPLEIYFRFAPSEAIKIVDTANTILKPIAEEGILTSKVRNEGLLKANQLAASAKIQSFQGWFTYNCGASLYSNKFEEKEL